MRRSCQCDANLGRRSAITALTRSARARIGLQRFTIEHVNTQTIQIYRELLGECRASLQERHQCTLGVDSAARAIEVRSRVANCGRPAESDGSTFSCRAKSRRAGTDWNYVITLSVVAPSVQMITVTALALMLLFAVDDRRGLQVRTRLLAQLIAATVATYTLLPAAPWWLLAPIIVIIIWSMNLYNFMDGADGLAGGMALFGFGALAIVAANAEAHELAAACGCMVGAAAGFLFHNFPPQRCFWGTPGQCRWVS